ncbi:metalloregulator ArsR/SmtB family transcription factor [Parendozoicomonas sp. Alg238-R29]|uniref:ArsR/SmtB family transcription factor n=1 Tax=Parendozoicomonas sp. Alg238-R29 TaxID=2993446 RepID=UPI00248ED643|nr:metalloregulator ArsR/SmtB family transcription factor [Parendozoicomonas sp. Alg238-R29]
MDCETGQQPVTLNDEEYTGLSKILKVLGDEGRLRMVVACMNEPRAVCYLSAVAGLSQSLTSHHLRSLREMRVLRSTKRGRQVFYELDDDHIRHVLQDLIVHVREDHQ